MGGELVGCVLGFDQVLQDFAFKGGRPVYIAGSIGYEAFGKHVGMSIKLVPADIVTDASGQSKVAVFTPAYAYATFGATSTAGKEVKKFPCDNGGFCAAYTDQGVMVAFSEAIEQGFRISYQRLKGGLDIETTVHPSLVPDTPDWEAVVGFNKCTANLFGHATGSQGGR